MLSRLGGASRSAVAQRCLSLSGTQHAVEVSLQCLGGERLVS